MNKLLMVLVKDVATEVTKKDLTQWFFKITDYADELLDKLDDFRLA